MDGSAIILTSGLLQTSSAKTAHGLIRGSMRYEIKGVVDEPCAGKDAGEVLDGQHRGIPVYATLEAAIHAHPEVTHAVIGVALPGGRLSTALIQEVREALEAGLSAVNGLHEFLSDIPELVALAAAKKVRLIDVRKSPPKHTLHFWTGKIAEVKCPKIAVMGTDCAIGKRTTARMLCEQARKMGLKAEWIYTGQTGWLQGARYGFILDSIVNDFVSGELEHALWSCYTETRPDVIFIEGQAAMRNPSGPCGAEFLVSGKAEGVILQHQPAKKYYHDYPEWGAINSITSEIQLVKLYGSEVLGVAMNTAGLDKGQLKATKEQLATETGLPVAMPIEEGVEALVEAIVRKFNLKDA